MKSKWKPLLLNLFLPLFTGFLAWFLTRDNQGIYQDINQPALAPPSFLFPVVWTILYLLMGISAFLVSQSDSPDKKSALKTYFIQLFFNFIWSLVFFNLRRWGLSLLILIALWIYILIMILQFSRISPLAAKLQIPYLLWVTFAGYLNLSVFLLN